MKKWEAKPQYGSFPKYKKFHEPIGRGKVGHNGEWSEKYAKMPSLHKCKETVSFRGERREGA
jgi:hypothetical protein